MQTERATTEVIARAVGYCLGGKNDHRTAIAINSANGTHRFYASVVAGFSHVPTVPGWIPDTEALPLDDTRP
jgi:hypothetical protein